VKTETLTTLYNDLLCPSVSIMFFSPTFLAFRHHDTLALQQISIIWEDKTDNNMESGKEIRVDIRGH
jgi:hypothetical protein